MRKRVLAVFLAFSMIFINVNPVFAEDLTLDSFDYYSYVEDGNYVVDTPTESIDYPADTTGEYVDTYTEVLDNPVDMGENYTDVVTEPIIDQNDTTYETFIPEDNIPITEDIPSGDVSDNNVTETYDEVPVENTIVWMERGEFPYITSIILTDEYGNSSESPEFNISSILTLTYFFNIPAGSFIYAGDIYRIHIPNEYTPIFDLNESALDQYNRINATYDVIGKVVTIRMYENMTLEANIDGSISIACNPLIPATDTTNQTPDELSNPNDSNTPTFIEEPSENNYTEVIEGDSITEYTSDPVEESFENNSTDASAVDDSANEVLEENPENNDIEDKSDETTITDGMDENDKSEEETAEVIPDSRSINSAPIEDDSIKTDDEKENLDKDSKTLKSAKGTKNGSTDITWTDKGVFPFITSIKITDENGDDSSSANFDIDQKVNLNYFFAIPNDATVSPGDMYTLNIPPQFELVGDIPERQLDESSGINATWEVKDNKITVRFYQDLDVISNVSGFMTVGCWFSKDFQNDTETNTIDFEIAGDTITIDVHREEIASSTSASVTKSGAVANKTTGTITWTIKVTPDDPSHTLAGIKVVDTYDSTLHQYVPGTFKFNNVAISDSELTILDGGFEGTFPENTPPGAQTISYTTRITKDYLYNSNSTSVGNHVETYMPNGDKSSETNATVTVNKIASTKTPVSFNSSTNVISWKIVVNPHKLPLKNVVVIDNFKGGEILTNTIKYNGKSTTNYTYNINENSIAFNLGDISDTVTITFDKHITDMSVFESSNEGKVITNEAIVTSENEVLEKFNGTYGLVIGTGDIYVNKKGIVKSNTTNGRYITWNVGINNPTETTDYTPINEPIVFTDQITDNLTPITGLKIVVHYLDGSSVNQTIPLSECYNEATKTFNYTLTPGVSTIGGKTVLPECWYVFTYDTRIDNYSQTAFTNTAYLTIGNKTLTAPAKVNVSYNTSKAIQKSGSYSYNTNTYNWTVTFNTNAEAFENPVITDILPAGYVPAYDYILSGSTKVYFGGPEVGGARVEYNPENNVITIRYTGFVTSKKTWTINVKYAGNGSQGNAKNVVELTSDNFDQTFSATNTINYSALPILEKKTDYVEGDTIPWSVPIILDNDDLGDMVLEDQLIPGLSLDISSVKLYYANVSASGKVTASTTLVPLAENAVSFNETTGLFSLSLPTDLDTHRAYLLNFNTYIMDKSLELITNSIVFKGTSVEEVAISKEIVIKVSSGDSGLTGEVGSIKIYKFENGTSKPIPGVAFQLLNRNKEVMTSVGWATTNSQGIAEFKDCVRMDTIYYIQEVRTVTGYVFNDEMYEVMVPGNDEDGVAEITVYNDIETTSVTGRKTWDDANNQDGLRPESIVVKLLADGEEVRTATVTAENGWEYSFENLPKFKAGTEIVYTVDESAVPGYRKTVDGFDITNKHIPATVSVEGKKTWDDSDNQDGLRPESIVVKLLADGEEVRTATVTAENEWEYSFENLPKFKAGTEIVYTVDESAVPGYRKTVDGFNITNKHVPATVDVEGKKAWDDADNQDGLRPESIVVKLLADGEEVGTATVTAENEWEYSFENLPKFKAGTEIVYTVDESAVPGYRKTVDGFNITNKHVPATVDVEGKKTWDDGENQDGLRPESIVVKLLADGEEVGTATVTAENEWEYSFENLPKFKAGTEIVYTVDESAVPGYRKTVDGFNITNKHVPATVDVEGKKAWDDADNQDGLRPESIVVKLLADGEEVRTATVTAENEWEYSFENLPKFKAGTEIVYTVDESAVPGYRKTVDGFNITNKHVPATVDVEGKKTWDDGENQDGLRPESIVVKLLADGEEVGTATVTAENEWEYSFENLPKFKAGTEIVYTVDETEIPGYEKAVDGFNITNKHVPATVSVEGKKTWDDGENQDGLRPESIVVKLLADGEEVRTATVTAENEWEYSFKDLPKFKAGTEIVYTVDETEILGYEKAVDGFNITNKHVPATVDVEGKKTWNDGENQDGLRPESIVVKLLADGEEVRTATVTAENEWEYSFKDLPKFKAGTEIVYTVDETEIPGYEKAVDGFNITNKHVPATVSVEGKKTWDDGENQDGLRPESIVVKLLADGEEVGTATVTAENEWEYSFENLPKFKAGTEIVYTVDESAVPGYRKTVDGFDITNKHIPATVSVEGKKTWDDGENQDGLRPESIVVKLLADGEEVRTATVTAENEWKYSFENLPKFKAGTEIVYTVDESAVPGYRKTVDGFDIMNKHVPATVDVEGKKAWDDADNQDGLRPESIVVKLFANGIEVDSKEVKASDNWEYTFKNLPKFKAGAKVVYTVDEVAVQGYTKLVNGYNITNKHVPGIKTVTPPPTPTNAVSIPSVIERTNNTRVQVANRNNVTNNNNNAIQNSNSSVVQRRGNGIANNNATRNSNPHNVGDIPQTGDNTNIYMMLIIMICSALVILIIIYKKKKMIK